MLPGSSGMLNSREEKNNAMIKTKIDASDLARKRKMIYEAGADATCDFEKGEPIPINRTLLAFESKYFHDIFFGPSPNFKVKIQDFDREAFQKFLDCLFELTECSALDALVIYPIAHKYDANKCLRKCISVLRPTEMNENVCLALNLALLYECQGLIDDIINFIKNEVGIITVIINKKYCSLLEPKTMSKLMEHIELDSYVWKMIFEWRKVSGSQLKSIHDIFLTNISLSHFESVKSIFDFHKLTNRRLLNSDEILDFLERNTRKNYDEKLPEKSGWALVKKGEEITETVVFRNSLLVPAEDGLSLNIWRNRVHPTTLKGAHSNVINCKVRYNFGFIFKNYSKKDDGTQKPSIQVPTVLTLRNPAPSSCAIAAPTRCDPISSVSSNFRSPISSDVHEISENFSSPNARKFSFPVSLSHQVSEIKSVEITFSFSFDCRILKTSISGNFVDADKLYFTKDIVYS